MKGIFTLILVIGAFALIFSVANPIWVEIQNLQAEQVVVEDTLTRLAELQQLRDELLAAFNSIPKSSLDRLDELLPEKPDIELLLVALENISKIHKLELDRVSFAQTAESQQAPGASEVGYGLTVKASYADLKDYLSSLENNLRLIDVKNISFSAPANDNLDVTLQAASYFKPR